ncbi:MAG TPA: EscU/YscU/HrcU family type III secretion system export apparatus switch protein [Alphaproteobacteria bacterium]|nr:flagellar protein FhlB [Rhodospirillaceae bacterium]HRJ11916.1 EscU/YscU/HrcU family type III secretion system export apparatus switch protein [Alphaproteobacteria bacterium]
MAKDSEPPVNPKTKAIALAFDPLRDTTPRVVATGKGALAEQILRLAFDNGIRVRKDETLTEMLGLVEIDHEIPVAAIVAVAEILSYVYRENGKMKLVREARNIRLGDNE